MNSRVLTRRGSRKSSGLPELSVPSQFRCPISLELMTDPVTLPTGITYDRQSIETWLDYGHETCPVTHCPLSGGRDLTPNHALRRMIQTWCVANRKHGVDRIPTPRIPLSNADAFALLSQLSLSTQSGDLPACLQLAAKVRSLVKESERNKRCFTSNGAAAPLSAAFARFPAEEILAALAALSPLGQNSLTQLAAPESLLSLAKIIRTGGRAARTNAAQVLKELLQADAAAACAAAAADGMAEALAGLLRDPTSLRASKASLVSIFYMASSKEETAAKFAAMGLVPLLLDALVDCDKSTAEKIAGVLDALFNSRRGREAAYQHALAIPLLVKKILRVSAIATEFSVSALWKLCVSGGEEEGEGRGNAGWCVAEALQVGAFQKLLLILQVGCGDSTKEKASALLKLLNGSRRTAECVESSDLKSIKRPF